ncbi:Uu.00g101360.m01.CDS01 [Anthostomella pinea]|uniref:Endonuclease III homolog n=1 Tax=Anthostomella pinea TaxID=933095 RepID=A0AAI8YFB3_9PEZI|nr:Uu.00g101360.m01.CDS01 [Anthostomella pinea]
MRSSRVSQETSKLFGAVAQPASPPRRTTRSSLSRFAYSSANPSASTDIEDAIPDVASSANRKRKRTTVLATATPTPTSASLNRRKVKTETVEEEEEVDIKPESKPNPITASKRQRKPARKATDPKTGSTTTTAPSDWEEIYNTVKTMRQPGGAAANAAVDTMGCERLADRAAPPRDQRFQTLIALMLSSQTKDTTNAVAMRRLQTELPPHSPSAPPGLTLENVLAVDPETLNQLIWAVGFHNNKTKYIKAAALILRDQWDGDIPDSIVGLTALPGVGPKMAHLCLSAAWGRTEGIGVDVHVHRITNLWGWHTTKGPEETRRALEAWLPRDRWRDINGLLVGLGQTVCLPVGRRCGECELGLGGLCPAAERKKVVEGMRVRESTRVEVGEGEGVVVDVVKEEMEVVEGEVVVNEQVKKEDVDVPGNVMVGKEESEESVLKGVDGPSLKIEEDDADAGPSRSRSRLRKSRRT